ncbi:MAG: aldehyde dehydrogenase family protein [Alphaproteobacteria bacterium]
MDALKKLGCSVNSNVSGGLSVTSPDSGAVIATLEVDTATTLNEKVTRAKIAQEKFSQLTREERARVVEAYAAAMKTHRVLLAEIIHQEAGKTLKEAQGEADGSADIMLKTIRDATLPDLGNMSRVKERKPVGVVGLITSFNFPMAVAHWTMGAAFLAGNSVVWKPSEKTPLSALACKAVFDAAVPEHADLFQVIIGMRDVGEALVAHEGVDMISATGSVAMGQGIKATLAKKKNNRVPPILELGGNNGVIISDKMTDAHLEFTVKAIMGSFLGTTGQRCTNTRRVIVHVSQLEKTVALFTAQIETFLSAAAKDAAFDAANDMGYAALIDKDAFERFEAAKKQVVAEGGKIVLGTRLWTNEKPEAYHVQPALAVMPTQTNIMHKETFAPLLFIAPYKNFDEAITMLNAPENAGLVAGIYTLSQKEADQFARTCTAGHALINAPKGTGTPAHGMGFGGNKHSGCGEILNSADPLQAFTRADTFTRIVQNKDIALNA